jgi:hypothetical protein
MELADRGTLREMSEDGRLRALSWAARKELCRHLCLGLQFLHDEARRHGRTSPRLVLAGLRILRSLAGGRADCCGPGLT